MKQKEKAYTVFQEALKYDYENWKIWENFLWTSTDCGYFEDVINAYHRLLDLKEKYVDLEVLKVLCSATTKRLNDANDVPIVKQKQKLLELFGRLSSLVVNDWQVYWYYAEIVLSLATVSSGEDCNSNEIELDNQSAEKYFGLLLKAFRNLYNQNNWELSVDKCREVVYNSTEILKRCNQYAKYLKNPQDTIGSLFLSVKGIINKLKLKYKTDETSDSANYSSLLYLKDINKEFIELQIEYEAFKRNYSK